MQYITDNGICTQQTVTSGQGCQDSGIRASTAGISGTSSIGVSLDWGAAGHTVLDFAGLVPVFGEVADGLNTLWYLAEGAYINAGLSAAALIPFAGWAATGGKLGKQLAKLPGDGASTGLARACRTGSSFAPSTRVLMADGSTRPIEDVNVGDTVLAADPETGRTVARAVTLLHRNTDTNLVDVTVTDETGQVSVLETTDEHPFWNETAQTWTAAGELAPGTQLQAAPGDGAVLTVTKVAIRPGAAEMRNLTIADIPTYYVMAGATPVLVHNSNCPTSAANGERLRRQLAEEAGQLPGVRSADDIFDTPSVLSGGVTPDQVRPFFANREGWVEEGLGRGRNAGAGWVIREYTSRGNPTGRMLRWNPGGGHHGDGAYWRVVGPEGDLGGVIR